MINCGNSKGPFSRREDRPAVAHPARGVLPGNEQELWNREGLYAHPAVRKVNQQTLGTEGFQTQDVLEKKQLWGQGKCQWPP